MRVIPQDFISQLRQTCYPCTTTNLQQSGNNETLNILGKFKNTLQSSLARINYSFKDKYLVTASVRRDGTSSFQISINTQHFHQRLLVGNYLLNHLWKTMSFLVSLN